MALSSGSPRKFNADVLNFFIFNTSYCPLHSSVLLSLLFGCETDSIRPGWSLWECPCDEGGVFREQEVFIPVRNVTEPHEEERSEKS